jgi:hypothetical protein
VLKPNIGTLNALIRITIGFAMLSFATARLVRKPWCLMSKIAIGLGAMKVAEGIVRFCPITEAWKLSRYMNMMKKPTEHESSNEHSDTAYEKKDANPSSQHFDASDDKIEAKIASDILGL